MNAGLCGKRELKAIHSKYPIETEYERGYADGRREAAATIRQRARARSTAMNKGGEL